MTSTQPERLEKASRLSRRLLALLVGLLASLALIVSGAASARNVVRPQPVTSILSVGPYDTAGRLLVVLAEAVDGRDYVVTPGA